MPTINGRSIMNVNFDQDEIGHSKLIRNISPSLACTSINYPMHVCREIISVGQRACICTLVKLLQPFFNIGVLSTESCPVISGFECVKTVPTRCQCRQLYKEEDDKNTGFCLEFSHNY